MSRSAQKILGAKQSEYQTTSAGDRVPQNEPYNDMSKSEYTDAYSYGGVSGTNEFSLLSNVLPFKPIMVAPMTTDDRNNF